VQGAAPIFETTMVRALDLFQLAEILTALPRLLDASALSPGGSQIPARRIQARNVSRETRSHGARPASPPPTSDQSPRRTAERFPIVLSTALCSVLNMTVTALTSGSVLLGLVAAKRIS
jgi:hypothetical protein